VIDQGGTKYSSNDRDWFLETRCENEREQLSFIADFRKGDNAS
jgi:hypothetical protein